MSGNAPARAAFSDELEALRLQVEVMALLVSDAVTATRGLLEHPDIEAARAIVEGDDAIDAMHTSLIERCYQLLARESPVAADLRLVVSVIRFLHELERIGDLCLRIANAVTDVPVVAGHPEVYRVLLALADNVTARFVAVQQSWSANSLEPLEALADTDPLVEFADPLVSRLMALEGSDAVRVALAAMAIGRSLDRIGDHAQIMASRLRYLITGDTSHLAEEVAW
ncbi:MAG: phosphate uptake regulator PhoU [Acidimicrobiales bacterium]